MKCPNCNREIDNDSVFCEYCGARMKKSRKALWIILSVVLAVVIAVVAFTIIQEHQARLEAERKAELVRLGYVDLGLPSGMLWRNANECGSDDALYTYDEAVSMYGNQLPTKQQFEELENKCTWTWTGSGSKVIGPNGNSIYLPAAGCRSCAGDVFGVGAFGGYWSSAPEGSDEAWYLYFNSGEVFMEDGHRCAGRSVRLVQNPYFLN